MSIVHRDLKPENMPAPPICPLHGPGWCSCWRKGAAPRIDRRELAARERQRAKPRKPRR